MRNSQNTTQKPIDRTETDRCTRCGREIAGISANGPTEHTVLPCGHRVPVDHAPIQEGAP